MPRPRARSDVLLAGLLFTWLLISPSCAVEKEDAGDPPAAGETLYLPDTEAGTALADALAEAGRTNRNVFAHTGADW